MSEKLNYAQKVGDLPLDQPTGPMEDTTDTPGQLEVSHYEQTDILLNHDAVLSQEWGTILKDTFQNGIPSSWEVVGGGGRNVMAGEINGKKFVAKLRRMRLEEGDAQIIPEQWDKTFLAPRKQVYAAESVVNEIRLAPKIKAALATDEVQRSVKQIGLSGVSLVEPILGVVSRSPDKDLPYSQDLGELGEKHKPSTDKYLVYEYIAGTAPDHTQGKILESIIGTALENIGIDIGQGDLRPDHFIIDTFGKAHLLDTEMYTIA